MTDLAPLTTLRLGGPAGRIVEARSEEELVALVRDADGSGEPLLLLAGGSNVVIADDGFHGTVVRLLTHGITRHGDGLIEVQAGEPWDPFVARCIADGLAGIECLSGIPGSTGATPIQNVGAYGQEIAETVTSVRAYDRQLGRTVTFTPEQCGFGYRTSVFKRVDRWVVESVTLRLNRSGEPTVAVQSSNGS